MVGSTINQYKILEKIGAGGQGTVYKAQDTKLDRTVVIKVLPPELTAKTANFKRFEREAQLCSQLDHPNICTIYDFQRSKRHLLYCDAVCRGQKRAPARRRSPARTEKRAFASPSRCATRSPTRIRAALFTATSKPET